MAVVPIYGELASFGGVNFPRHMSYLASNARKRKTAYASLIGKDYPVDVAGGGRTSLASPILSFVYEILGEMPSEVETAYNLLETQLRSTNGDGTSGQYSTLTVYLADGTTTVACTARFEDCSPNENDRSPFRLTARLSFTMLSDFS